MLDLVADTGMEKRSRARFMALGVNGVGAALMIVVFAQTGGITGAEVGIAGGTTVIAQRVLEAVFGDQAVRRLADHRQGGAGLAGGRADVGRAAALPPAARRGGG